MSERGITVHDFPFVHTAAIEVTSRCNLRCTFAGADVPLMCGFFGTVLLPESIQPDRPFWLWIELEAAGGWHKRLVAS